jgi:hypothetical protein
MLTGVFGVCGARARPGVVETGVTAGCEAAGWLMEAGSEACCALATRASKITVVKIQPQRFIICLDLLSHKL